MSRDRVASPTDIPSARPSLSEAPPSFPPPGTKRRAAAAFAARLALDSVELSFGGHHALKGVSLEVPAGGILCLLGPSGCGKTSLLRVAAGIERPSSGRVLIDDREVAGPSHFVPPEQRSVGLMFQDFALFPHLSIIENVAFGLKGLPRAESRKEAMAVLERVDLARYAYEFPHILSGGEQQRVALARAIVPRPSVMLMDEPFSGLDVQLRDRMQDETLSLLKETRATSLIVTHDPAEAMRLADEIGVMRDGRLVQQGVAEDLYRFPADLFVARLFSEINELPVRVGAGRVETPFGALATALPEGSSGVLCIRERGIRLDRLNGGRAGRIVQNRFLGDVRLISVAVDGVDRLLRARVNEADQFKPGDDVMVQADTLAMLVFPQEASNPDRNVPD